MKLMTIAKKRWMLAFAIPALLFGTTACEDEEEMDDNGGSAQSKTFMYAFNNGELGSGTAYEGTHSSDLTAELMITENGSNADITVTLNNTIDGEMYPLHAHDAADPASTPNGTPYNETPNSDILVTMVEGNGGTVSETYTTNGYSYAQLVNDYEGFFVVHDPTQAISTVDLSTYLAVGTFGRDQGSMPNYQSETYNYAFNTGQIASQFAYSGSHPNDLAAVVKVEELANDEARVTVTLQNTLNGEVYPVHAHDKADPNNTPNGTPYDETPNSDVMVQMAMGTGAEAVVSQNSSKSFAEITGQYEAFFVVHDPTQAITTTDPTTYVVLGNFARK